MADEPSWDEIFSGSAAGQTTSNQAGTPSRAPSADDLPAPMTRRERRERERLAQEQAETRTAPTASAPSAPAATPGEPSPTLLAASPHEPADTADTVETPATAPAAAGAAAAPKPKAGRSSRPPRDPKPPRQKSPKAQKAPREKKSHRRGAIILVIVLVVVLGGGTAGGFTIYNQYGPKVAALFGAKPSDDYTGSGDGKKVDFTIVSGDIGSTISKKLAAAHITKSASAPYKILLANQNIQFQPGTYSMFEHMSAQSAIDRLQDSNSLITTKLVIPEGTSLKGIIRLMSSVTKIPLATVTAAAKDYRSYGLPSNATSLEGYLFPATYDLQPGKTANFYFQQMVDTMKQHLIDAGVSEPNWEHTIIFASLVQKEAGLAADFPKVARVFQNRIDQGMLLQSDATVAYGAGTTNTVTTTDAQRADASNPYNTYVHKGLPPGPISNPGDVAINAVLHPATGSWLYFVTVNLETGETVFSTTYADHQKAVAQFQAWLRAHPTYQ
ncbi:endolytic transglycosylase MltG [Frondihabitans australicus]|uniref:Endolytic murein transglycosylase n=1 Tax=Frondihabitans australicus TaxID=386892 RepID=A0A495IFG8_9MICO|nr:endolytic transglycosylase MltG [Frondihabitans australicus]RKR74091.1 UPF0755 protein [Frondihabitans australicus]